MKHGDEFELVISPLYFPNIKTYIESTNVLFTEIEHNTRETEPTGRMI